MFRLVKVLIVLLLVIGFISASKYFSQGVLVNDERFARTSQDDIFGDNTDKIAYLDQNWNTRDSLWFYNTTQGSNWMPYAVFLHLEQSDSETLFRSDEQMNRYRYLVQVPSSTNPDGLPVGFVKNTYKEQDYLGFTCAACHTGQLDYNGVGIRIDGAPALADMDTMLRDVEQALKATIDDEAKFIRLAKKVVDTTDKEAIAQFKKMVTVLYEEKKLYNQQNNPLNKTQRIDYGFSRLDAFGRIFNRTLSHLTPNDPSNYNPPNAPVSYPFLWDTPHSDFVQWNGIGNNHGEGLAGLLGSLSRNTGEVLGVFASFEVSKHDDGSLHHESSTDRFNLQRLERHLQFLQSPQWPNDLLPPIDQQLAAKGKAVYDEYKCGWCHSGEQQVLTTTPTFQRDNEDRLMIAQFATLPWIRTDPQMVMNALKATGKSGIYQGQTLKHGSDATFAEVAPVLAALGKLTEGIIFAPESHKPAWKRQYDKYHLLFTEWLYLKVPKTQRHNDFEVVTKPDPSMFASYKARTLNGIWATAPYLHNGSVRNLYELFLPACSDAEATNATADKPCRSNRFTIGSRQFDPVKVGFVSKNKTDYPALFEFDTQKAGNSNRGHEYAAGITPLIKLDKTGKPIYKADGQPESFTLPVMDDVKRKALVEYLKTL